MSQWAGSFMVARGGLLRLTLPLALICGPNGAAQAAGPFNDQPATAQSLPGDNLPPFGMLDAQGTVPPPPSLPAGVELPGAGAPPTSTAIGPTLEQAVALAQAAVDSCAAQGFRVGASVVNSAGEARALIAGDGASGSFVFVGMRKAIAALEFGMPSSQVLDLVNNDPAALARVTPAMFLEGGGMPIFHEGQLIGAIGVSGAAGPVIGRQDEICATAALNTVANSHG